MSGYERTDADIATAAKRALEWRVLIPHEKIQVMVEHGRVTLSGEVKWDYERRAAERAVQDLLGVTGVSNLIKLAPSVSPKLVEKDIHDALVRQADQDAKQIHVAVNGAQITLQGKVHSWAERNAAQHAAWSAPGVHTVVNQLAVQS